MSCGSCQQPGADNWNTDHKDTLSCNRNNCRCGNEEACMYYNRSDGKVGHYNYVAVQGAGDPEDPRYSCMNKAFDFYNDSGMYGDHAIGNLGTYTQAYGESNNKGLYGLVNYDDSKCTEHEFGKRDMCDKCNADDPNFYRDRSGNDKNLVFGLPDYLNGDANFGVGLHANGYGFDVNLQRWLLLVVVIALLWYMKNKGQLPNTVNNVLNKTLLGYSVMNLLIAVAIVYFVTFFF